MNKRRNFLGWASRGCTAFVFGGAAMPALAASQDDSRLFVDPAGLDALVDPDINGLRLLPGFASRVIARSSRPVVSGSAFHWHGRPDGGACFATSDDGWIMVSNSEIKMVDGGGGVGAIRFNAQGSIIDAYPILSGTDNNCAGGKTPWQTWLSCEEVDRGYVYECDPFGTIAGRVRPALGRFRHEAVAVDPVHGHLYLTEDENDGGFYRFLPANSLPALDAGRLQIAQVVRHNGVSRVVWHDVPDPAAQTTRTSHQVEKTTWFDGGEGIAWHAGLVYFTTKGDNRVWSYDTNSGQLDILYDAATSATPHLTGVDNVTISAAGDVLVAEDGGDMQIVLLGPDGLVLPIVQVVGQNLSEICGPAFDPSFQRLYFSSQTGPDDRDDDGITYEIYRI